MAQSRITLGVRKRWLLRQGTAGLFAAYVLMKAGAPMTWFLDIETA